MIFNDSVLNVLQQVNGITNSVILKYPQTVAVAETGDIQVLIDFGQLKSDKFEDMGLKDSLSEILALFKLFPGDRQVNIQDNTLQISSGRQSSTFISSNIALMDAYDADPIQFQRTKEAPSVATFNITVDDMKQIKAASGVFKDLTEVILTSADGDIELSLGATNRFQARSNTYSVTKDAETTKEFQIKIPVENFKALPTSEYTVEIKYNSQRDSYRILMINKTIESLQIMLAIKMQ